MRGRNRSAVLFRCLSPVLVNWFCHQLWSQKGELEAKHSRVTPPVGAYLIDTTRDSTSSSRSAPKMARAAGGGGVAVAPYFRKQVMERIRNTLVDRNTSRRELKVALAKVFTGEFFMTWLEQERTGINGPTDGRKYSVRDKTRRSRPGIGCCMLQVDHLLVTATIKDKAEDHTAAD